MKEVDHESISAIGLCRVGLPTALCLAEAGFIVYGIEKDEGRLEALRSGKMPFHEPGMQELFSFRFNRTFFPTRDAGVIKKATC